MEEMYMPHPAIRTIAKILAPAAVRLVELAILWTGLSVTLPAVARGQPTACVPLSVKKRTYVAHTLGARVPRKGVDATVVRKEAARSDGDDHPNQTLTDPVTCAAAAKAFYAAFDLKPSSADRFVVLEVGRHRIVRFAYDTDRPTGQAAFDPTFSHVFYKFWR